METQILLLAGGFGLENILIMVAIMVVFYFFILRPQTKKANEQRNFIDNLQKGDMVVTAGGIHGKVLKVEETTLYLLVDTKSHLTVEKSTISTEMSLALENPKSSKEAKPEKEKEKMATK